MCPPFTLFLIHVQVRFLLGLKQGHLILVAEVFFCYSRMVNYAFPVKHSRKWEAHPSAMEISGSWFYLKLGLGMTFRDPSPTTRWIYLGLRVYGCCSATLQFHQTLKQRLPSFFIMISCSVGRDMGFSMRLMRFSQLQWNLGVGKVWGER